MAKRTMIYLSGIALVAAVSINAAHAADAPASVQGANLHAAIAIDVGAPTVKYSPMIFGGFLEHFDHQVYGGVYDPGSPLSDTNDFRLDVIAAVKELRTPVVRWPGWR